MRPETPAPPLTSTLPNNLEADAVPSPALAYAPAKRGIDWAKALPGVALAGIISALTMAAPLGMFGLGILAGGLFSVILYRRRKPLEIITPGMGAQLGAASGGVGFAFFMLLMAAGMLIFHMGGQLREGIARAIDEAAARNPSPQTPDIVQQLKSPEGIAIMIALMLVITFLIFLIVSSVGGLVGASVLQKRERR
jgi:hypothetical protein